jgi:hypothetical protein
MENNRRVKTLLHSSLGVDILRVLPEISFPMRFILHRPYVAMVRRSAGKLKLSVVPPDWKETTMLTLTLQGRSTFESDDAAQGCKVMQEGDLTRIEIPYNTEKPLTRHLPIPVMLKGS